MNNLSGVNSLFGVGGGGTISGYSSMGSNTTVYGRVYQILLTDDKDLANSMGVPQGTVGAIQFRFITNGTVDESTPTQTALHLGPHNRTYPIKNEVVEIVSGPSTSAKDPQGNNIFVFYYTNVVDIWNSSEHNSIPDISFNANSDGGAVTGDLKEIGDIVRLQHLPGDIVQEGRFGNSVRMGSSNTLVKNVPWKGPDSSPVYIIRNGQSKNVKKGTKVTIEDMNSDGTSLYFLSDQTINFVPANLNFDSYGQTITNKKNVVVVSTGVTNTPTPIPTTTPAPFTPIVDKPVVEHETQTAPTPKEKIFSFLPDREAPEFFKDVQDIQDDDGARHVQGGSEVWKESLNKYPVTSYASENISSGFSNYFLAYMQHQQGSAGIKAALYYANKESQTVPYINPFSKENIQHNLENNIGRDFGKNPVTPANFIKYWKNKFSISLVSINKKISPVENILIKWARTHGVPIDFVKLVCKTESGFNPQDGNNKYKGLFAIGMEEFQSIYKGDTDIYNTDKNTDVGVRLLKKKLANVSNILKVLNK